MKISEMRESIGRTGFEVSAKIVKVNQFRDGHGEYGPYSFQSLLLEDETGKIACVVKNHNKIPENMQGKQVNIQCKSVRGELKGTAIKQEEYENDEGETKTVVKLIVTKAANVTVAESTQTPTRQAFTNDDIIACFVEAGAILTDPKVVAARTAAYEAAWQNEDIRAVAISLAIQKRR